jgi:hypothetical protein
MLCLVLLLLVLGARTETMPAKDSGHRTALTRISVRRLEQLLAADENDSDGNIARRLSGLELTERLSTMRLLRLESQLPGLKSRQALIDLADVSAFLALPAEETLSAPAPDLPSQREMMRRTVDYVSKTIHQLPNFYATRRTASFEDKPALYEIPKLNWDSLNRPLPIVRRYPLHIVNTRSGTILYRGGEEIIRSSSTRSDRQFQPLRSSGEFGPILGTMLIDAAKSTLTWSRWEEGVAGREAVYQYSITRDRSHYEVGYGCFGSPAYPLGPVSKFSAYQGEISVDPSSGAILRLVLRAEPNPDDPFIDADLAVEYGPVEIGGKIYICPIKSIALFVGVDCGLPGSSTNLLHTLLNNVVFEQYHVFRADSRVFTRGGEEIH